jgi:hypothetical protein
LPAALSSFSCAAGPGVTLPNAAVALEETTAILEDVTAVDHGFFQSLLKSQPLKKPVR